MASIRKRRYDSGRVAWVVSHGSPPHRLRRSFPSRRDAEFFAASLTLQPGGHPDPPLKLALDQYLTSRKRDLKPRSFLRYWEYSRTLYAFAAERYSEDAPVSAVTPAFADRYKAHRLDAGRSVKTVRSELEYLSTFLRWAVRVELIEKHPLAGRVKYPRLKRRLPHVYSVVELERLFQSGDKLAPLLETCYRSGFRLEEALGLKVEDVIPGKQLIRYRNSKGEDEWFPMPQKLAACLAKQTKGKHQDAMVFDFAGQGTGRQNKIRAQFHSLCRRLHIQPGRIHDLKSSYVTHLLDAGVPIHIVQRLAHHRNIATTMRYIRPPAVDAMRTAVDRLPL